MSFLTPTSVIAALVLAASGVLIKALVRLYFKSEPSHKHVQAVMLPAVLFVVGFYATKIIELSVTVDSNRTALARIEDGQYTSLAYLEAIRSIGDLQEDSTLRHLLSAELGFVTEKLRQIALQELTFKREEVIPKWEKLILNANRQVLATNVVSLADWKRFSPTEGAEVHRKALNNGVKIQRVFIYHGNDTAAYERLIMQAQAQVGWGVDVRVLNGAWITESPFVSDLLRDVGTQDIVIYDGECVLLTNVDGNRNIICSTLTSNQHRLQKAKEFFTKLWDESEAVKIPQDTGQ